MTKPATSADGRTEDLQQKLTACSASLRQLKRVVVAFSAGVDSTFLLALAARTLGAANVLAAVGVSPSLPQRELASARELAAGFGVEMVEVPTGELDNPQYAANPAQRCYFCKHDLFSRLLALAQSRACVAVVSGANADDTGDFRPGLSAGAKLGVHNPLMDAGLTKREIRELSRQMGLPTWDKPAMACLASRVPYDSPITAARLGRIERAENLLRDLGFRQVRVRDHDTVARIEVPLEDLGRLIAAGEQITREFKAAGYIYVTADLAGLRSGSSNEVLGLASGVAQPPSAVPSEETAHSAKATAEGGCATSDFERYARQMVFEPVGLAGQKALAQGRVLIVGVGGLGSWVAELLARAGVGYLRLADDDRVDMVNLHRQGLYAEADAQGSVPKVQAAAARLRQLNSQVTVQAVAQRVDHRNIAALADDVDVIIDGTDNFATRFLINDYSVKAAKPWIFAGAVQAEAQAAAFIPGRTPCLRCVLDELPPVCRDPNCRTAGVLSMPLAAIASFEAMEAVKILLGRLDVVSPFLLKLDLWSNQVQRLNLSNHRNPQCECCGQRQFEYLEP